jgi:hypothetical protein
MKKKLIRDALLNPNCIVEIRKPADASSPHSQTH